MPPEPNTHTRLEILIDRHLIHRSSRMDQRLEEPRDCGAVFHFNEPWEGILSGYSTVIRDHEANDYKLYYRGLSDGALECRVGEVTCLALSNDGIHWHRPRLNLHAWDGDHHTNIILARDTPDSHNFTPFIDTRPGISPNQRYKALAGVAPIGLHAYGSSDGIHWRRLHDQAVIQQGMFDSQNVAFWSEHEQAYLCFMRTWTGKGFSGIRTISRSSSPDFIRWSRPRRMRFNRRPLEHLYTNQTQPYPGAPHLYVGIAARFMPDRQVLSRQQAQELNVDPEYYQDCSDVVLLSSRGGHYYERCIPEALLRPGIGLEHWVSRTNFPAHGLVPTGDRELSLYLNTHYAQPSAQLRRYAFTRDRLGYLEARHAIGEMITKPIAITPKSRLAINMATSAAGFLKVAVCDENEQILPGFGWQDSAELIGNELDRAVSWGPDPVQGQLGQCGQASIRLAFRCCDSRLYALSISDAPKCSYMPCL